MMCKDTCQGNSSLSIWQTLKDFEGKDDWVEVYTNREDTTRFAFSRILKVGDEDVLLAHMDRMGRYDGYLVKQINSIYRLEYRTRYVHQMQILWAKNGVPHEPIAIESQNNYLDVLRYSMAAQKFITAELLDSGFDDVKGFVTHIEGNHIRVAQVDEAGYTDGETIFSADDISHLACDTADEVLRSILYAHQKEK